MIYLDSSVLLATILSEARRPPMSFWAMPLMSSALLRYEVVNRLHARGASQALLGDVGRSLRRVDLIDLTDDVLRRALLPFPTSVRTLDGLHLATADYLARSGAPIDLATFDRRMTIAATAMGLTLAPTSITG